MPIFGTNSDTEVAKKRHLKAFAVNSPGYTAMTIVTAIPGRFLQAVFPVNRGVAPQRKEIKS